MRETYVCSILLDVEVLLDSWLFYSLCSNQILFCFLFCSTFPGYRHWECLFFLFVSEFPWAASIPREGRTPWRSRACLSVRGETWLPSRPSSIWQLPKKPHLKSFLWLPQVLSSINWTWANKLITKQRPRTPASPSRSPDPSCSLLTTLPPTVACEEMGYGRGDHISGVTASTHEKCAGEHKRTVIRKAFSFNLNHDVMGVDWSFPSYL